MTAHDPRVTLTEAGSREEAGALCPQCNHRAIWHHDERGCQYHGSGESGCPCALDSDQTVAQIIAARLAPIRALEKRWRTLGEHGRGQAAPHFMGIADDLLAALSAHESAPQLTSGTEGQGEGERAGHCDRAGCEVVYGHRHLPPCPVGSSEGHTCRMYEGHDGIHQDGHGALWDHDIATDHGCDACPDDHCNATGKPWCTDEETR